MKTELEKFNHTVDVLVKAYLNDTLEHGNCHACAVGNIISDAKGYSYERNFDGLHAVSPGGFTAFMNWYSNNECIEVSQIVATGYSAKQLTLIENSFEQSDSDGDRMFNGLMAVVETLAQIHNIDLTVKENAKLLFVKS